MVEKNQNCDVKIFPLAQTLHKLSSSFNHQGHEQVKLLDESELYTLALKYVCI